MNLIKLFIAIFVFYFLVTFISGINILVSSIGSSIIALFCTAWIYCVFLLLDSKNQLYEVIAFLCTGIVGTLILIGLKRAYKKMDLHFMD
jgi:hypothetical protein